MPPLYDGTVWDHWQASFKKDFKGHNKVKSQAAILYILRVV